jgi:hypothetical protein
MESERVSGRRPRRETSGRCRPTAERDFGMVPNRARVRGQIVRGQTVRPPSVATQFVGLSIREKGENAAETTVARVPSSGSRPTRAGVAHLELDLRLDHAVDLLDEAVVRREEAEPAAEGWGRVGVGGRGGCVSHLARSTRRVATSFCARRPDALRRGRATAGAFGSGRDARGATATRTHLARNFHATGSCTFPTNRAPSVAGTKARRRVRARHTARGCPSRAPGAPADVPATPHRSGVTADVRAAVRFAPRGSRNPRGRAANSTTRRGAF